MLKMLERRPRLDPVLLQKLTQKKAWSPDALIAVGIPPEKIRVMLADGRFAVEERAYLEVGGRKKTELTRHYIWGPDIPFYL
jgi:hypothetical protein